MRSFTGTVLLFVFVSISVQAQMLRDGLTYYGSEWINFDNEYFKTEVTEDGLYQITFEQLTEAGMDLSQIEGSSLQLWNKGNPEPLYVSNEGLWGPDDYLIFYGRKNRGQLDKYMYADPETHHFNPEYSLITDAAAYFLTWSENEPGTLFTIGQAAAMSDSLEYYLYRHVETFQSELARTFEVDPVGGQALLSSDPDNHMGFATRFNQLNIDLPSDGLSASGPNPILNFHLLSDRSNHQFEARLNNQIIATGNPGFFEKMEFSIPLQRSFLDGEKMELSLMGLMGSNDRYFLPYVELLYPKEFDIGNREVLVLDSLPAGGSYRIEIKTDADNGATFIFLDYRNNTHYQSEASDGRVIFDLESTENKGSGLVFKKERTHSSTDSLHPVVFPNPGNWKEAEFIIISHGDLFSSGGGQNYVQEYADYRASENGGSFNTLVIDVRDLYNLFGYGTDRHPQAISNFAFYAGKEFTDPQYFFIIGKGRAFNAVRTPEQRALPERQSYFVPTFGSPGSDVLMISQRGEAEPIFPLGRIAASNPEQIRIYLEKVIEYERPRPTAQTIEAQEWKKRTIHLVGGLPGDAQSLRSYMSNLASVLSNTSMGSAVNTFIKESSEPVQSNVSDAIFDRINEGASIVTFMGHSSPTSLDFNINNPLRYNNFSRMPLLIALGCRTGDFNRDERSVGEEFTFYERRGFIASVASTSLSYSDQLFRINREFYLNLGERLYGKSIGKALKEAIRMRQGLNFRMAQQFLLHGDPALVLPNFEGPDLTPDASTASVQPTIVNATDGFFDFSFDLVNLGVNVMDTFSLRISRELPDGQKNTVLTDTLASPDNRTNLSYTLPVLGDSAVGLNKLFVEIDIYQDLDERPLPAAKQNNHFQFAGGETGYSFLVVNNSARAAWPNDFGIVGDPVPLFRTYTNQLPLPDQNYIIEIDTLPDFSSAFKISDYTRSRGGAIEFRPPLQFSDETVYYWRVSPETTPSGDEKVWDSRSFVYLEGADPGWNHSHYGQWRFNRLDSMVLNSGTGKPDMASDRLDVRFQNYLRDDPLNTYGFFVGAQPIRSVERGWEQIDAGITVAYIDTIIFTLAPNPPGGIHGSVNAHSGVIRSFPFRTNTFESRRDLMDFIDNTIPDNSSVYIWTVMRNEASDLQIADWAEDDNSHDYNIFTLLEKYGAERVRELEINNGGLYGFTFLKRNGQGIPLAEDIDIDLVNGAFNEVEVPRRIPTGRMTSVPIGMAAHWDRIEWGLGQPDSPADTFSFTLFSYDPLTNRKELLERNFPSPFNLNNYPVSEYPWLKLEYRIEDFEKRTGYPLNYWRVFHQLLPDFTFSAYTELNYSLPDTVQQGQNFTMRLPVENLIPTENPDSLSMKFQILKGGDVVFSEVLSSKKESDSWVFEMLIETSELRGEYQIFAEINPDREVSEANYANNLLVHNFFVLRDGTRPLLDVVFDGLRIMNGDLVSPRVEIQIELEDNNPYLPLNDTSVFEIEIIQPDGSKWPVVFDGQRAVFQGASLSDGKNIATIRINGDFLQDGEYQMKLNARDASGNPAGAEPYRIRFNVINRQSLSNIVNYPNPFSDATQFVYTLTGDQPPAFFKIQIMTVSGRIVREITQYELGPMRTGTHRFDFVYNGTDEFGDRLANGVYLYRVIARDESGGRTEHFENNQLDQFFKRGWGKMVILR